MSVNCFTRDQPDPVAITDRWAVTGAEAPNALVADMLRVVDESRVPNSEKEKLGYRMKAGGSKRNEILINLPHLQSIFLLTYPQIMPTECKVEEATDGILAPYYPKWQGLQNVVAGLPQSFGKMCRTPVSVQAAQSRLTENDYEIFKVEW